MTAVPAFMHRGRGQTLPFFIKNMIADVAGVAYRDTSATVADYTPKLVVEYGSHASLPALPAWASAIGGVWWYAAPTYSLTWDPGTGAETEVADEFYRIMREWEGDYEMGVSPAIAPLVSSIYDLTKIYWMLEGMQVSAPSATVYDMAGDPRTVPAISAYAMTLADDVSTAIRPVRRVCGMFDYVTPLYPDFWDEDPENTYVQELMMFNPLARIDVYRVWNPSGDELGYFIAAPNAGFPEMKLRLRGGFTYGSAPADGPTGYFTVLYMPTTPFVFSTATVSGKVVSEKIISIAGASMAFHMHQSAPFDSGFRPGTSGILCDPTITAQFYTAG